MKKPDLHQTYWSLEIQLCQLAAKLGMKRAEMVGNPDSLPVDVRSEMASILWAQVNALSQVPTRARRLRLV